MGALLSNVYVQLRLGSRETRTACAENENDERSIGFGNQRALFVYNREPMLHLVVRDERKLTGALRGDPLIGQGSLQLGPEIWDGMPRWVDIPLTREGVSTSMGKVCLR